AGDPQHAPCARSAAAEPGRPFPGAVRRRDARHERRARSGRLPAAPDRADAAPGPECPCGLEPDDDPDGAVLVGREPDRRQQEAHGHRLGPGVLERGRADRPHGRLHRRRRQGRERRRGRRRAGRQGRAAAHRRHPDRHGPDRPGPL
ncbi:MAG: Flagellar basal-body rod modification protein FlgD, partial [uncultured Thermoleophilia bacterium]